MSVLPLEPDRPTMERLGAEVLSRVVKRLSSLDSRPAGGPGERDEALLQRLRAAPTEHGAGPTCVLDMMEQAAEQGLESAGPGNLAYIPGSGLYTASLAELYSRTMNRHGGLASVAAGFTAMETGIVDWIAQDVCGLPHGSRGLLTSGGSMATLSATVTARHRYLGDEHAGGTVYTTAHAHHSVAKAARLAGIRPANIRIVPHTPDLRMNPVDARLSIEADRAAGLRPFLLVATAGTTDTGTIDPLTELADLTRSFGMWFHVDAAYGGFFRLTERGRDRLRGMELADSVTLDPHKSLFMPFGTGALAVRDPASLAAAHGGSGDYLQDLDAGVGLPNWSELGPELTRETRGVRMWLPLRLHGIAAFRDALNEKLDLTDRIYAELSEATGLEIPFAPDLSTVVFRVAPTHQTVQAAQLAENDTLRLLGRINAHQRVVLSSTKIQGRTYLRLCTLSHRTHESIIAEALELILDELGRLQHREASPTCPVTA